MQVFIQWLLGSVAAVLIAGFLFPAQSVWAFPQDILTIALFIGAVTAAILLKPLAEVIANTLGSISLGGGSNGEQTGSVKWFNPSKGFGFITSDDGEDIFVHQRSINGNRRRLTPGQQVSFIIAENEKGFYADDVMIVD